MNPLPPTPPDITGLAERLLALGGEIAASREEIDRFRAPGFDGLWVTTDGRKWSFRPRRRRKLAA